MAHQLENKQATLKTIAELTGLSLSTVSLALRGGARVKPATREKVAEIAAQVGYVPNRAGVRLRTGKTNVLALILTTEKHSLDFTRTLINGIGAQLQGTKYFLNVLPEFSASDQQRSVRYILETQAADGVILTHTSAQDPRVALLAQTKLPFVCYGRTAFSEPHAYYDFHAERFIEMAVQRLVSKGRKRILLAAVDNQTTNYSTIAQAFERATAAADVSGEIIKDAPILNAARRARHVGQSLASRTHQYDAIISNNELTVLSLISGLQDSGQELGTDYDLVCKQTTDILPTLYPNIDTVEEDVFASGRALARLLIELVHGSEAQELQILQEPIAHWRSEKKHEQ